MKPLKTIGILSAVGALVAISSAMTSTNKVQPVAGSISGKVVFDGKQPEVKPLTIGDEDRRTIVNACDRVIADTHRVPGAIWNLGKKLAGYALQSRRSRKAMRT